MQETNWFRERSVRVTPEDKPDSPVSWRENLLHMFQRINNEQIMTISAGVAFYALLAVVPAIAAFVSLYGLFSDPADISHHLASLRGFVPHGVIEILRQQLLRLTSEGSKNLGIAFLVGLVISLWSANSATKAIFDGLNVAFGTCETRSFFRLTLVSLAFTISIIVFALVALAAIVVLPYLFNFAGNKTVTLAGQIGMWPVLLALAALVIGLLYRYGPGGGNVRRHFPCWGAVIAGIFWLGASLLFSWYAATFGAYSKTYGVLGALVSFMVWIWISSLVVLVGAMFEAELERRRQKTRT